MYNIFFYKIEIQIIQTHTSIFKTWSLELMRWNKKKKQEKHKLKLKNRGMSDLTWKYAELWNSGFTNGKEIEIERMIKVKYTNAQIP